jgi:signal transduction histidine kinase
MPTPSQGAQDPSLRPTPASGNPPSHEAAEGNGRRQAGDLRRLKVVGVALPVLFILLFELIPFELIRLGAVDKDFFAGYGFHILLVSATVVGVVAFSFAMFHFIGRAQAEMAAAEHQRAILAERERIARELHDSLAQVLGATHLRLRALSSRDDVRGSPGIAREIEALADVCEEGYRDVREAILELHESSRADRNLLDSLRAYVEKYSTQCGIETSLETALERELALPPRSEIQIIRVVQEALTNVRKHSGAASAEVRIVQENGSLRFVVEDNGRGFDSARALVDRDGFGLHSMRERMELIGGTLVTDSASGRGTRVVAEVPVSPTA